MLIAITRAVSSSIDQCELTNLERQPIDLEMARRQHHAYEAVLAALGAAVHSLPAEDELPDAVFVEDTAIVLDECAVITRPGAASRRPETESIAAALGPYRTLEYIRSPGTVDGGDVLCLGKDVFIGVSTRSNRSAIGQMQDALGPSGYRVSGVPVSGCLHLKSAVTQVAEDALLINPRWVDRGVFPGWKLIEVDPSEPYAANALMVSGKVIYQPAFPRTGRLLEQAGLSLVWVDASELGKAEGALTCCSLIFNSRA